MKPISALARIYLSRFSKPACNRVIYRTIRKQRVSSILELGMDDAKRAENMIRLASCYSGAGTVRYTGIDFFESHSDSRINLKTCHQRLSRYEARIQLVPGDAALSIPRIANSHMRTDLLVISSQCNTPELEAVWFYVPRMLHAASIVFIQDPGDDQGSFKRLGRLEIERMVRQSRVKTARVA